MKKTFILLTLLLLSITGFSQKLTEYKYVIVPAKFSFLKDANKYNLNALTKMVFEKKGYVVLYDTDILPDDLAKNRCKALSADMLEDNTLFSTKIKIELKDCKNQTVFFSEEGTSRLKELDKAYIQAFRIVGKSIDEGLAMAKPATNQEEEVAVVKEEAAPKVVETVKTVETTTPVATKTVISGALYAQPIAEGYQLVDSTPKIVMKLLKTGNADMFIAKKDAIQGVLIKRNNAWYFEYYQNEKLLSEKMDIKF